MYKRREKKRGSRDDFQLYNAHTHTKLRLLWESSFVFLEPAVWEVAISSQIVCKCAADGDCSSSAVCPLERKKEEMHRVAFLSPSPSNCTTHTQFLYTLLILLILLTFHSSVCCLFGVIRQPFPSFLGWRTHHWEKEREIMAHRNGSKLVPKEKMPTRDASYSSSNSKKAWRKLIIEREGSFLQPFQPLSTNYYCLSYRSPTPSSFSLHFPGNQVEKEKKDD